MVKIIGAGLCRTGTTSTVVALDSLGFGPVYHYNEVSFGPKKFNVHIEVELKNHFCSSPDKTDPLKFQSECICLFILTRVVWVHKLQMNRIN